MNKLVFICKVLYDHIDQMHYGLCGLADTLYQKDKLTLDEVYLFEEWIKELYPDKAFPWPPGDKSYRLQFLNKVFKGKIIPPKTSEILIKIRNNKDLLKDCNGLCNIAAYLHAGEILTQLEHGLFMEYIWRNRPFRARLLQLNQYDFFWKPGYKKPRLKWLDKHIKRCKKRGD